MPRYAVDRDRRNKWGLLFVCAHLQASLKGTFKIAEEDELSIEDMEKETTEKSSTQ